MPHLKTKYFGELAYDADSILQFPAGIPGFENERSFLLIEQDHTRPLAFMQSAMTPELCFLALPVRTIDPEFHLRLTPEERTELELPSGRHPVIGRDVLCLALVTLSEAEGPTSNLMAPIVMNLRNRRAVQSIQVDSGYSLRHALQQEDAGAPC
jgi:flagellar assembly factor FliW